MRTTRHVAVSASLGIALALIYGVVALTSARATHTSIRPLYEGPCPPSQCPICPPDCPSYPSYHGSYTPSPSRSSRPGQPSQRPTPSRTTTSAPPRGTSPTPGRSVTPKPSSVPRPSAPPPSEHLVGPAGGSVASSDGRLTLVIPAGGVSKAKQVDFRALAPGPLSPAREIPLGTEWAITATPVGPAVSTPLTAFNLPIEVLAVYTAEPPNLIAQWNGSRWVPLSTTTLQDVHRAVAHTQAPGVIGVFTAAPSREVRSNVAAWMAAVILLFFAAIAHAALLLHRRQARL